MAELNESQNEVHFIGLPQNCGRLILGNLTLSAVALGSYSTKTIHFRTNLAVNTTGHWFFNRFPSYVTRPPVVQPLARCTIGLPWYVSSNFVAHWIMHGEHTSSCRLDNLECSYQIMACSTLASNIYYKSDFLSKLYNSTEERMCAVTRPVLPALKASRWHMDVPNHKDTPPWKVIAPLYNLAGIFSMQQDRYWLTLLHNRTMDNDRCVDAPTHVWYRPSVPGCVTDHLVMWPDSGWAKNICSDIYLADCFACLFIVTPLFSSWLPFRRNVCR